MTFEEKVRLKSELLHKRTNLLISLFAYHYGTPRTPTIPEMGWLMMLEQTEAKLRELE